MQRPVTGGNTEGGWVNEACAGSVEASGRIAPRVSAASPGATQP